MLKNNNEINILIVDDVEDNLKMMADMCKKEPWNIDLAHNGKEAIEKIKNKSYDVIITDLRLGDIDGLRLGVFAKSIDKYTEVIIVTAYSTLETAVESIREDVFDYIFKPFYPHQLINSIKKALKSRMLALENLNLIESLRIQERVLTEKFKNIEQELIRTNEKLAELAVKDELTELYNYRYFMERMEIEISRADRYSVALALAIFDIDDFKKINDTYGHETGNIVLRKLAKIFKNSVRNLDVVARYGGEEFVVILPMVGEQGLVVAERIVNAVRNETFTSFDGQPLSITISGGLCVYPDHGKNIQDLINNADKALYKAKEEGKNKIVYYGDLI